MISSCIDLACPFSCCYIGTQSRSCMEATVWFSSTLPLAKFVEGLLLPFTPAHSSNDPTLHKICGRSATVFPPARITNVPNLCKICGGNATAFHPCVYFKCLKPLQNLWKEVTAFHPCMYCKCPNTWHSQH
jgi:hypothetical protein